MKIRSFCDADVLGALSVVNAHLTGPYGGRITPAMLFSRTFRGDTPHATIALVGEETDGEITAFCALCDGHGREPANRAQLEYFHVHPGPGAEERRESLWAALMGAMADWNPTHIDIRSYTATGHILGVPEDDEAALAFFESKGFAKRHCEAHYIFDASNARSMAALPPDPTRDEHGYEYRALYPTSLTHARTVRSIHRLCLGETKQGWANQYRTPAAGPVVVVHSGDELVAFVGFTTSLESPSLAWGTGPQLGPVLTSSAHRRRGIGKRMCAKVVHEVLRHGAPHVFLTTTKDGMPSELYRKIGFRYVRGWWAMRQEM